MEETIDEVRRLKASINSLISALALPAIWTAGDSNQIATALLDVLLRMLRLDFVYLGLKGTADSGPLEMMRSSQSGDMTSPPEAFSEALKASLRCGTHTWPLLVQSPSGLGDVSIAAFRLGLNDEVGVLVAGSRRTEFPDMTERLLLNVAANQATIGLQEARLLGEQRRVAERVHKKVAQGIREQEQWSTEQLEQSEFYLAEGQRLAHMGSWAFNPCGFFDHWSQELFRIYGLDPSRRAPTLAEYLNCVHPQDRKFMAETIRHMVAEGLGCDLKKRIVRPNGEVRYIRCVGMPVTDGGVLKSIVGTAIDVTEQELMTQERQRREAYLAEAQRLSHTGSFGWRPSAGEIFWSEETFRIFDYDPATKPTVELVLDRVHPEDRARVQERIERATRDGRDFDFEHRLSMPDRSDKHVHVVAHALKDESGTIEFVGAVMDVTTARQVEEKIRQQEMELRQVVDLAPQLVAVFGAGQERLYANRILLDYLGLTLEEWRQRFDSPVPNYRSDFLHPDDWERVIGYSDRALSGGSGFELEMRLRKRDGSYRWFLARYNPLRDEAGQITRWYVVGTDIEDRKQAEERLQQENVALREEVDKASMFEEIVGASPALRSVLERAAKVAPTDSTVLITGETGTGKELIARAIHRQSPRSSRAFVTANCAAIPRDLIASELFGHEKGAFTGATQRRVGRFELAEGGTILLDEIGEVPGETQVALLRVLQEREFQRVGGNLTIRASVRVIAATHRDLKAAISAGTFRDDLYYRLSVFPIEMPPLRERREDIPLLVEYFVDRYARKLGRRISGVNKQTLHLLESYSWPGNIRELQNVIERSVIICETDSLWVDEKWLRPESSQTEPSNHCPSARVVGSEKEIIEAALAETRGRVSGPAGAAVKLGMPPSTLDSKIKSLKINKYRYRPA